MYSLYNILLQVMEMAQKELLDFRGTGHSVMEMSHRSAEFSQIIHTAEHTLRELMWVTFHCILDCL